MRESWQGRLLSVQIRKGLYLPLFHQRLELEHSNVYSNRTCTAVMQCCQFVPPLFPIWPCYFLTFLVFFVDRSCDKAHSIIHRLCWYKQTPTQCICMFMDKIPQRFQYQTWNTSKWSKLLIENLSCIQNERASNPWKIFSKALSNFSKLMWNHSEHNWKILTNLSFHQE